MQVWQSKLLNLKLPNIHKFPSAMIALGYNERVIEIILNENQQNGQINPSLHEITLGINSLHNQPLLIAVPLYALVNESGESAEITYEFIFKIDAVLRSLESITVDCAYRALKSELDINKSHAHADFWHMRHWDDPNDLATFIVEFGDDHESRYIAGKYFLASSCHRLFANPCLAPQIRHEPAIMVLVDDEGNMALPFDEPLNAEGNPVPLGLVQIPTKQFQDIEQANAARVILEAFGYTAEIY